MKPDIHLKLIDDVIEQKLKVVDDFIEEIIEPIADVGSPEKLIGKKYEEWTAIDLQLLSQVYGTGDNTPLGKLIAKKEVEKLLELEKNV